MAKAIGLGGVFIHLKGDSKALFDWYETYLGLEFSDYGTGFISGHQLMVISFKRVDNSNAPILNFRVDDIETIMSNLKNHQIKIISDITNYDYGKFSTIEDPFGNQIELWEANEIEYIRLVEQELLSYKKKKNKK